jgi:hypothetical protein
MTCARRDLVEGRWALLLWCLPAALILAGTLLPSVRAALWIPSFAIMGVACLWNARGCGRLHCHVTGPLFLIASLATTLDAGGVISISWKLILVAAASGTLFACSLEWLRGKYIDTSVV